MVLRLLVHGQEDVMRAERWGEGRLREHPGRSPGRITRVISLPPGGARRRVPLDISQVFHYNALGQRKSLAAFREPEAEAKAGAAPWQKVVYTGGPPMSSARRAARSFGHTGRSAADDPSVPEEDRMDLDAETVKLFQEIILDFWEENGRRNLPWRQTTDPWLILLAETLLRKTTSRQAVSVYEKMAALSPQQIAHLSESRFEEMLRPLGMHRIRTKQIRLLAAAAAEAEADDFQNPEFLASLPGVGRYISSAVLCFAFGRPKPALDTNMIRVLQRVFGVASKRSRPREDPDLWRTAEMLVPSGRCREFNWGVLDLASSLCRPRRPRCPECRLNRICRFYKEAESGAAL